VAQVQLKCRDEGLLRGPQHSDGDGGDNSDMLDGSERRRDVDGISRQQRRRGTTRQPPPTTPTMAPTTRVALAVRSLGSLSPLFLSALRSSRSKC
jgi:hypothetical protein